MLLLYNLLSFLHFCTIYFIKEKSVDGNKQSSKSSFPDIHMKVNPLWLSDSPTVSESLLGLYFVSFFCQQVFSKIPGDTTFNTTEWVRYCLVLAGVPCGIVRWPPRNTNVWLGSLLRFFKMNDFVPLCTCPGKVMMQDQVDELDHQSLLLQSLQYLKRSIRNN